MLKHAYKNKNLSQSKIKLTIHQKRKNCLEVALLWLTMIWINCCYLI